MNGSVMKSIRTGRLAALVTVVGLALLWGGWYALTFFWPVYDFALRLPSPDGRYELIVLRGDAAAFADFSYNLYVLPRGAGPQNLFPRTRVHMAGIWRGSKYLVYSGYNYPMFRWTGPSSVEVDLADAYPEVDEYHPVKRLGQSTVVASLVFGKTDVRNARP
jgi:hypothetical protein